MDNEHLYGVAGRVSGPGTRRHRSQRYVGGWRVGLLDYLFGRTRTDRFEPGDEDPSGSEPVQQFYFVGNDISGSVLQDAMVVLEKHPPERVDDVGRSWSVVLCNEECTVAAETDKKVCVHSSGTRVVASEDTFRCHEAWLLSRAEREALTNAENITETFPFPESLRGTTLPVGTNWSDEELQRLLLSFGAEGPHY